MTSPQEERLWTIIKRLEYLLSNKPNIGERARLNEQIKKLRARNSYLKQQVRELEKALNI